MSLRFLLLAERRAAFHAAKAAGLSVGTAGLTVLFGPGGSGKSALLTATGAVVEQGGRTVRRFGGSEWQQAVSSAASPKLRSALIEELAVVDLLQFDDMSRWLSDRRSAERFVQVLERRRSDCRGTVVADRRLGSAVDGVAPAVRDRLRGATMCHLRPLGADSARRLLTHFADRHRITFASEAIGPAIEGVTQPGELASLVAAVATPARRRGGVVDRGLLASATRRERSTLRPLSIRECEAAVAREFGLSVTDLRSDSRASAIALPRQIAMHLSRAMGGATYEAIGEHFGGRNHSTALHACRRIARRIEEDEAVAGRVDRLRLALCERGAAAG